jgi:SmpA / OmlA family.
MAALVLGAIVMTACSREEGRPIPERTVSSFVVGKTTESDVLKVLGAPEKKIKLLGEDVWVYRHIKSHGFMSVHTSSKTLRLRFDDRGVLQDVSHNDKKRNEFF